jgi:DNA uptake protein ComE-like DNA-binding protein
MFSMNRKLVCVVLAGLCLGAILGAFAKANTDAQVDLNRASLVELMRVPGITEVWARRIVRYRPYRTKRDLVDKGIVTPEVYKRIRDGVVVHRGG